MLGISLSIISVLLNSVAITTSPTSLFALGEPGVWFDPSDLTTLFQDNTGMTAVTTPGQTVGLMLDKSKGLLLGSQLVSNPGGPFVTTTGWLAYQTGTNFSVVGGNLVAVDDCYFPLTGLTVGRTYQVDYSVVSGGGFNLYVNADSTGNPYFLNRTGTGSARVTIINPVLGIYVNANTTLASITVRELAGNHATQATLAARPTYAIEPAGGRRNLLTYTELFSDSIWVKRGFAAPTTGETDPLGGSTAVSFLENNTDVNPAIYHNAPVSSAASTIGVWLKSSSATTISLSTNGLTSPGTVSLTTAWQFFSVTQSVLNSAGPHIGGFASVTRASGIRIYVWHPQLELGSAATNYQKVTTQYDVTEAGVASMSYLYFDGVNDAMATSTITPGIDKAQVFAGVRKLSDNVSAILVEFSATFDTNNGSFGVLAPSSGGGNSYRITTRGTNSISAGTGIFAAAPNSSVLTAIADIGGDIATLRRDGSLVETSTGDQGTGNYLAYPLYLGARGGTSVFFTGHLYSLITRFGANLDTPTITNTETWVAGKTGFYTPVITGVPTIGVS